MKAKNQGFTLIELLVAMTIFSIMTAALLQTFLVSRQMERRSRQQAVLLDAAKKAMEEIKGTDFGAFDEMFEENGPARKVVIGGTSYELSQTEEGAWRLGCALDANALADTKEDSNYELEILADKRPYDETDNAYEAPNLAGVNAYQNLVLSPELLTTADSLLTDELLLKVNPPEHNGENGEEGEDEGGETIFDETDIRRFLILTVKEEQQRLSASLCAIHTVDEDAAEHASVTDRDSFAPELTLEKDIYSASRPLSLDEKTGMPVNRIYLFLPAQLQFNQIALSGNMEHTFETYVVAPQGDFPKEAIRINQFPATLYEGGSFDLYTNLGEDKPVSLGRPKNRRYHLQVNVYKAGEEGGKPLVALDSTKGE